MGTPYQTSFFEQPLGTISSADGVNEGIILPIEDAKVHYFPHWLAIKKANEIFTNLHQNLAWQQDEITVYGKKHQIPRLQAWYGDPEATYEYSGLPLQPLTWTPTLRALKIKCEQHCQQSFNSVLANLYRNGDDSMGMHSDNEKPLGSNPSIASLSLGAERRFDFKHKHSGDKYSVMLKHGSLLLMQGYTQEYWQHGMAKSKKVTDARINLTFRMIKNL